MSVPRPRRPGAASIALLVILLITAAWWALALWPAGTAAPEWLARTRAACFGAAHGGLPDVGGWILLIGEPLGMLSVLLVVWRDPLRDDLRRAWSHRGWRLGGATVAMLVAAGLLSAGWRVARASAFEPAPAAGAPLAMDLDITSIALVDQQGRRVSFAEQRGRTVLLTVAYGHCTTVCPLVVHDVLAARREAGRPDIPLVVVTLDPWRDAPEQLPSLAAQWGLAPGDRVLSGSVAEVERALDALGIARRRDETTGDIAHSPAVFVIDARGHLAWRLDSGRPNLETLLAR